MEKDVVSREFATTNKKRLGDEEEVTTVKRSKASNDTKVSRKDQNRRGLPYIISKRHDTRKRGESKWKQPSWPISSTSARWFQVVGKKPACKEPGLDRGKKCKSNKMIRVKNVINLFYDHAIVGEGGDSSKKNTQDEGNLYCFRNLNQKVTDSQTGEKTEVYQICQWIGEQRIPQEARLLGGMIVTKRPDMHEVLQSINPDNSKMCVLCKLEEEDCSHLFFGCPFSRAVWDDQGIPGVDVTSHETFCDSLKTCTKVRRVFAVLWAIWLHRYNAIFKGRAVSVDSITHDIVRIDSIWARGR